MGGSIGKALRYMILPMCEAVQAVVILAMLYSVLGLAITSTL
jgi:hypothetical protein